MASPSVVFMMPQGRLAQVGLHPEVTRFHTLSSPVRAAACRSSQVRGELKPTAARGL